MSLVRGPIESHQRNQSDRRRAITHAESLWADAAARKFLDVVEDLDAEDRSYAVALGELDLAFDEAEKLLGPI